MAVNDIAIQEFVNAIKEPPQDTNNTYNAIVSRIDDEGVVWVYLQGSEIETPTASTSSEVEAGDSVTVQWRNNKLYIGGNYSNPSAGTTTVMPSVNFVSELLSKDISADSVSAATGYIGELTAEKITAGDIQASTGYIKDLTADSVTTQDIKSVTGYIADLEAENITAQDITADHATVGSLDANYAHITDGVIDNAKIGYADVNNLNANYAQINLANVNNAWIENGAIKKAEVFDENVFDLSGNRATLSRIDASKINVANLRADNLVVRRINGQPVVGGYTLIDSNSPQYETKNPQALGWYEFVNAEWVLSTDTTVDMTKAYYQEGNEVSLYDQAYIDALEDDLQQQIDGAVETYTGTVVPTLVNKPYTDWYDTSVTPIHDERAKHIGNIYYVVNSAASENGYCYRFAYDNTSHAYSWVLIKDSDVTKALSDISELKTFESNTTSWMDETDEGLETIRTNHTALSGVVDKTVKESVQLWFTKANTTAPAKPTAEVTSTSTSGNAWRKVVPAWNASYPNYYYCWQYKFVDGTFGWSDVVRDIAMGETQGTARDAKNTADAALPASTFTSFESTTFKDVKDTVTEHSTTFTNMTSRLGMNSDGTGANTDIVAKESALETTIDGISTRVGKTETKLIGMYATSSTAEGTRDKVATITPAIPSGSTWELGTGTIITVKFVNANTYAATSSSPLRLNVNGTGLKPITTYSGGALSEAEYKWAAGSTFTFTYNGTNWLMQDSTASVRINSAESSITHTATSIESVVANNDTYTAPDGTTKTNTIKSAIKQNANNIELKVSKDGVIASINASVEESGGSAVKISADKVNIEGAAIFTGSGRLSTTSLNNSYDAKGAAQSAVDGIEVGGRNLIKNTDKQRVTPASVENSAYVLPTPRLTDYGLSVLNNTETWWTYSFDYEVTGNTAEEGYIYVQAKGAIASGSSWLIKDRPSGHYVKSFKLTSSQVSATNDSCNIRLRNATDGAVLTVKNIKLEKGNKETDWSPAPEDVQAEIDAKKSVHTINATGTDASQPYATILTWASEGRQLTWSVDSTDGIKVGDTVRIKVLVSNMGTESSRPPVYVVTTCRETPTSSTSLKTTSHGLDTTIIDGGNILTNSITAEQINTGAITADELAANAVIAGKIKAGAVTADKIATDAVIADKIKAGAVTTDKIAANAITASKLAIGDFNNYITVNENNEDTLVSGFIIEDGWLYKNVSTSSGAWLSPVLPRWGNEGDQFRVTGKVKTKVAGRVRVYIYGRTANGAASGSSVTAYVATAANTEKEFSGVITISSAVAEQPNMNIVIQFVPPSGTSGYIVGYCKEMRCERIGPYITQINENGIRIHPAATENNSVVINASGMEVFQGGTTDEYSVAKYGDTARIGKESGSHLTLAPDSMSMSDGTKDVFNLLQKTMYIYWNRNYKGRQFANSTDRYVDSWETNTTISTWDSITVNYKLNNTSRTKKITSISNGVLANDEIYVHFNYSGTIITLTYGRGSSAASSDIIKLESAVVYYVTDEKLSQLHTGTYPNTTVSGALRIGNGTSDSNRRNLMLVDWSGTGKFKGDILAFCGANSSGGMSLTKAEENIDAFKYEAANGYVYINAYRVGRIVSLLCSVRNTASIAPGANLYLLDLTNAHLPKPLGTNTSGAGIVGKNMIIGNIYYNKTVTPNRYEFVCRNGGSTAVQMSSTSGVGFTITYICQMDEVSGEIKYMDD